MCWAEEGDPLGEVEEMVLKAGLVVEVGLMVVVVAGRRLCR